jgi:hypothetical protein
VIHAQPRGDATSRSGASRISRKKPLPAIIAGRFYSQFFLLEYPFYKRGKGTICDDVNLHGVSESDFHVCHRPFTRKTLNIFTYSGMLRAMQDRFFVARCLSTH